MSTYDKIYEIVKSIPYGMVMSYGQIAGMLERCTARMVGYAMAATPDDMNLAWWRVVNSQLKISLRASGGHDILQRRLLEKEGVIFNKSGKIEPRFRYKPAL
ncbi:MAG: MGMT family protein [Calditrichae bacterium]|nr:MGMT family protein [Calditrichota bacterium]MCB9059469.1 MGMT family protein [Calditrichia bacterium]